jgi:hypothetical protein
VRLHTLCTLPCACACAAESKLHTFSSGSPVAREWAARDHVPSSGVCNYFVGASGGAPPPGHRPSREEYTIIRRTSHGHGRPLVMSRCPFACESERHPHAALQMSRRRENRDSRRLAIMKNRKLGLSRATSFDENRRISPDFIAVGE